MAVNQYVRDRNGVNDHKKGNRTDSRRETDHLAAIHKQRSEDISRYKEVAEKMRRKKKYRQEDLYDIYNRIKDYIRVRTVETDPDYLPDKPLTVSGMILASGVNKRSWYDIINGDYDYKLYEYIDIYNIQLDTITDTIDGIPYVKNNDDRVVLLIEYSQILQKGMLAIETQTEERLYKKGRVGDIFSLKSVHGWREDATPSTVNQTLVIASEEQARKAIELLK